MNLERPCEKVGGETICGWFLKRPALFSHGFRFGITGGAVFCLDFLLVCALHWLLPPILAVSIAYGVAVAVHFWLSRTWVFGGRQGLLVPQLGRYAVAVALCWLSTVLLVSLALHWWTTEVLVAKAVAIPPVALLAFLLMKGFVFRRPEG
jgi:putative flippase GtrA